MKTFIINMEKDAEKRRAMLYQLAKLHTVNFEIFKACEGKKLTEDELNKYGYDKFKEKYGLFGSLPAFGCSLSHIGVYSRIVSEDINSALILEDDSIIGENLDICIDRFGEYIEGINQPAVILLTPEFIYKTSSRNRTKIGLHDIVVVESGCMATGYVINKQGAKLLSRELLPVRYIADEWGNFKKFGLKVYGVVPHLISYSGELGEIGKSQRQPKESLLRRIRHMLGRFKYKINRQLMHLRKYEESKKIW